MNHRTEGEGGGYLFNFSIPLPPVSHSDISLAITAESSPLHIASRPDSKQEPLVSEHKSLTNNLRTLMSALLLYSTQFQSSRTLPSRGSKWDWRDLRAGKFRWAGWCQQSEAVYLGLINIISFFWNCHFGFTSNHLYWFSRKLSVFRPCYLR